MTRFPVTRRDLVTAGAAVVAWVVLEHGAPELLRVDDLVRQSWGRSRPPFSWSPAAFWAVARLRPEGLLLLPFAFLAFDRHTKWALLLAVAALAAMAVHARLRAAPGPA